MLCLVLLVFSDSTLVLAVPQSGSCSGSAAQPCSLTGTNSNYEETIEGDVRQVTANGCPNNNPLTVCAGNNPNPANTQNWRMDIPATPRFHTSDYATSLAQAVALNRVSGLIGLTINGVEICGC
jgi:hypothetical protein